MARGKKPFFAKDIKVGDMLIEYYDHPPDKIYMCLFVLSIENWSPTPGGEPWTRFICWNITHEDRHEYCWDGQPMVFDEVWKINP